MKAAHPSPTLLLITTQLNPEPAFNPIARNLEVDHHPLQRTAYSHMGAGGV
jgi:hypothetical protein